MDGWHKTKEQNFILVPKPNCNACNRQGMKEIPVSEQSQWDTNWTQQRTRRRPPCVRVIVFSKDRAFQLGQYLRTLFAKNRGASLDVHVLYRADSPEMEAQDFVASYLRVKDAFPEVHFEREVDFATQVACILSFYAPLFYTRKFHSIFSIPLLISVHSFAHFRAKQLKELVAGADNHVLFGVDDALFCGDLPLGYDSIINFSLPFMPRISARIFLTWALASDAVNALQGWPSLLCVHLRLSPGLNFCHTANAIQCLPRCIL